MTDDARRERVARAISSAYLPSGEKHWPAWQVVADAAIAAMDEPQPVDLVEEVARTLQATETLSFEAQARAVTEFIADRLRDGAAGRLSKAKCSKPDYEMPRLSYRESVDAVLQPLTDALEDKQ